MTTHPWEYSAFAVTVLRTARLSPGFVRITLTGHDLRHFAPWGLDQRIKLVLPMPDGTTADFGLLDQPTPHPTHWYTRWKALPEDRRNVLRTYTPAAIRPEDRELDVDVFIHEPAGPASRWALTCRAGDALVITGPDIRAGYTGYGIHYTPPMRPETIVLVGDESAIPAMRNILTEIPDGTRAQVFVDVRNPADNLLPSPSPALRIEVVDRVTSEHDGLEAAIRAWGQDEGAEWVRTPASYAWIAGEKNATTSIRRYLTAELGIDRRQVAFLAYWNSGGPLAP
ncbi:siderophore-interacting protein [Microbacterium nymphoidis]|uniref:siderophore-interacting protein n=1 Tax=Microbacterium nymphoidis TaxID=2898586 RepID=UPI001E2B394F|nr:siderophore-interacting protein [Microbacterium nymphoidis]MCD2498484.1 siderophore-interacting protein [Microbacterium nymphoidis]